MNEKVGSATGKPFDVAETLTQLAMGAAQQQQPHATGAPDDVAETAGGAEGIYVDQSLLIETVPVLLQDERHVPSAVREALELHWRKEKLRAGLLMKKTALEASKLGPEANPRYKRENDRVTAVRAEQRAHDEATAESERRATRAIVQAVQDALKAQAGINADSEVQAKAIADAVRREMVESSL